MTPKEKAAQLFYWYENLLEPFESSNDFKKSRIKKCALIAVDEVLNFNVFNYQSLETGEEDTWQYWREVKAEIEKL